MSAEAKYLRGIGGLFVGLMGLVGAVNWLVDPFSLFDAPQISGFNANKPDYVEHLRLTHVYRVERRKPDCILLGTSRTGRGLRPDHPGLAHYNCYNLSLPAISMYEMRRYLQHARAVRPLKRVVLGMDFRVMNTSPDSSGAFVESRLKVDAEGKHQFNYFSAWLPDMTSSLASLPSLRASLAAIKKQGWATDTLSSDGFWKPLINRYDHVRGFTAYTENTLRRFDEAHREEAVYRSSVEQLRWLLRDAYADDAELVMLLSPSHAWHWQALLASGLWPRFEDMKRSLIRINEDEADQAGRVPFPVWDFSGSYGPALEPAPTVAGVSMKWFWEPVHYKSTLGDMILRRITGGAAGDQDFEGFGVRLDSQNLDAHLAHLRDLQRRFAYEHPEAVAHIEEAALKVRGTATEKGAR